MTTDALKSDVADSVSTAKRTAPPAFLTYKEFAYESRLSPSTVRKRVRQGEIRAARIGRSVRIPRSELERLTRHSKIERPGNREE